MKKRSRVEGRRARARKATALNRKLRRMEDALLRRRVGPVQTAEGTKRTYRTDRTNRTDVKPIARGRRVRWLLRHQTIWERFPAEDVSSEKIFRALQAAGLYSRRTVPNDAGIHGLISAARKIRRTMFARKERGW